MNYSEHRHTSSATYHKGNSTYVSQLKEVDRLTNRYRPNKVKDNNKYKDLYQRGECGLFDVSTLPHRSFFIHRETSIETLDDLIDYAGKITNYTIDTEDQLQPPPQHSKPALIQIQYLHENCPSIIILMEMMHLPPEGSKRFERIQRLCRTIFSNEHRIYSWGDATSELSKFYRYKLFDWNNVNETERINVQDDFKKWFHTNNPSSPYVKIKANESYGLQLAIYVTFNEWLDKRLTLANWGIGIDLILKTIPNELMKKRKWIDDEEEIRRMMTLYAINDCLAVTKLVNEMIRNPPEEPTMHHDESYRMTTGDHEWNETLEDVSDDDLPNMKEHCFHHEEDRSNEQPQNTISHDENGAEEEPPESNGCSTRTKVNSQDDEQHCPKKLTKTQRKNRKTRLKRYTFQVVRRVYHAFRTRKIKSTLLHMNIKPKNLNRVGNKIYLRVGSERARQRAEGKLDEEIFTEEHYRRIYKR